MTEKVSHDWERINLLLDASTKLLGHPKYKWLLDEASKELVELSTSPEEKQRIEAERVAAEEAAAEAEAAALKAAQEAEEADRIATRAATVQPPRPRPEPPMGDAPNGRRI